MTNFWSGIIALSFDRTKCIIDRALLKKTSEEGLDLILDHPQDGATATITYKARTVHIVQKVVFVLTKDHFFKESKE